MNKNIVIIGLNYEYNVEIGNKVCEKTDFYFLDVKSYLDYALMSRLDMLNKCGVEYLKRQENVILTNCANFENSVICVPYEYFFRNDIHEKFKENSVVIYLHFSSEELSKITDESSMTAIDLICYDDRVKDLKKVADKEIIVKEKTKENIINEILNIGGECEHK